MKRFLHRLAHFFQLNALEMIVIDDNGNYVTFFRCCTCGEVEEGNE